MALTRKQLAKRLREARESLGFTQGQVAKVLGVHRPTISEIEAGRRAVTGEELYRLSEIYAFPVSRLLKEPAPRADDVERVLFRREGLETAEARAAVRRFMERCRAEREMEELLGIEPPRDERPTYSPPSPRSVIDAVRQGERLARSERRRIDLGAEPLRNPLGLLEQQGVRVGVLDVVSEDGIDGVYFESEDLGPCIGVVPPDDWTGFRSTFTAAHEYAHWLLRDVRVEEFRFQAKEGGLKEKRANAFAAAFLMPEEGVGAYFRMAGLLEEDRITRLSPADIVRAMDYFGVSRPALLYRLENLDLITPEQAQELRELGFSVTKLAQALRVTLRSEPRVGTRLEDLAVEAWRRGLIGTGRAAGLLGTDIEGFRERMRELGEKQESRDAPLVGASAG